MQDILLKQYTVHTYSLFCKRFFNTITSIGEDRTANLLSQLSQSHTRKSILSIPDAVCKHFSYIFIIFSSYSHLALHSPTVRFNIWQQEHSAASGNGKSVCSTLECGTLTLPQISPTLISHRKRKHTGCTACAYRHNKACASAFRREKKVKLNENSM